MNYIAFKGGLNFLNRKYLVEEMLPYLLCRTKHKSASWSSTAVANIQHLTKVWPTSKPKMLKNNNTTVNTDLGY